MTPESEQYVVKGRDSGKEGHGIAQWAKSAEFLVSGRIANSKTSGLKPRPGLGHDVIRGLQLLANERPITEGTFRGLLGDASQLFHFLDHLETVTQGQLVAKKLKFDGGVEDIPGTIWALFTEWLETKFTGDVLSRVYSQCARVCKASARRKFGELPPYFLIPVNPFPQSHGIDSGNWAKSDDIDDVESKAIGEALIGTFRKAAMRIAAGRQILPLEMQAYPKDGVPSWANEKSAANAPCQIDELERIKYGQLLSYLVINRLLPQTAILGLETPIFRDVYAHWVSDSSLAATVIEGSDLSLYSLPIRLTILEASLRGEVPLSHMEAATLELSYYNLQAQAEILVKQGWLDIRLINKRTRLYLRNDRTDRALELHMAARTVLGGHRMRRIEQGKLIARGLPTKDELVRAMGLLLLRTGWNLSTALAMKADNWHRPHPIQGVSGTYVELFSIKGRSPRSYEWAQCSSNKPYTAYDIVRRVLSWTEPLRIMLRQQIAHIDDALSTKREEVSAAKRLELRREMATLHGLKNKTWLVVGEDGRITELSCQWRDVNDALAEAGVTRTDGSRIQFTQSLTRRAWAAFAYEKSGANLLLTKIALGHSDFASLITYIASQKLRTSQREKWVSLQLALLNAFRRGDSTAPDIIRAMVAKGQLSDDEATRVISGQFRSKSGFVCADPRSPDPEIDPLHQVGNVCGTQDCLKGCSKAFVTFETAVFVADEISRLSQLRGNMDVISWQSSTDSDDLQSAEQIFARYAPDVQKAALRSVRERQPRAIFGAPSSFAVRRAANVTKF